MHREYAITQAAEVHLRQCLQCLKTSDGPHFCGWCRAPFPRRKAPTAEGVRLLFDAQRRVRELLDTSTVSTHAAHDRTEAQLRRLASKVGADSFLQLVPAELIAFLLEKDITGRTTVHRKSCRSYAATVTQPTAANAHACHCPTRASHTSLDTIVGKLRAVYQRNGRTAPWDPETATGNPADSNLVTQYLRLCKREQRDAGVRPRQAPVISREVFEATMNAILCDWHEARQAGLVRYALETAQLAAFLSLSWYSMDRGTDLTHFSFATVAKSIAADTTGRYRTVWRVDRVRGKTVSGPSGGSYVLRDDGSPYHPTTVWALYEEAALLAGADIGCYPSFPQFASNAAGDGIAPRPATRPVTAGGMKKRLLPYLRTTGLAVAETFTLHSLRSSGAIDAINRGVPVSEVLDTAMWGNPRHARHYMELRHVHGLDGSVAIDEGPGRALAIATSAAHAAAHALRGSVRAARR